ncbi:MAG: hypothetical protein JW744_01000 [Candidatus Diapherotrites archaeon]|uniref:Alpha-galactosidase NEW3 domain-containing protein n=1 Tax=Candidatus Iainarchaeum sp. TaxID=3101447 RepID=A0A939C9T7_9ARCH|nr:hypothetical protein [Candidatus Diapherotrites archaeon]
MNSGKILLISLVLVLLSTSALASIAIIPSFKQASMSRNDSIGMAFQLKNQGYGRACIELEADEDTYFETSLSIQDICLNEAEATSFTLTVRTNNAPRGLHTGGIYAESDGGNATAFFSVLVSEEPEIELVAHSNDICLGEDETINVLVRNNSDEYKEVELQAENEMLLPYFKPSSFTLVPFQEKYVELKLHPSPYSAEGSHDVSMYAITDEETAKKSLKVDVVECGNEEKAGFTVRLTSSCKTVEKGKEEKIYFTVENMKDEEQKLYFSAGNDLDARMQASSAWLEANEKRTFYFAVNIPEEATVKDYNVTLHAWNSDYSVEKSTCIRPRKMHSTEVSVEENNLEVKSCGSAVFTALLENLGDYSEKFEMELDNGYDEIEAELSEDELTLEKHSKRQIFVNVSALPEAEEKQYEIELEVKTDDETFRKKLRFRVVEEEEEPEPQEMLEITGYSSSLRIDENSSKALLVSIRNNSKEEISGIQARLLSLPTGITAVSVASQHLLPGEEKQLEIMLKAAPGTAGTYSILLQAASQEYTQSETVQLTVAEAEEEQEEEQQSKLQGLIGLFATGGSALLGLAALVILITAVVLIARAVRTPNTNTKKEAWMRG